jgi:deoxyribonuclease-1-like protein
MGRFLLVLAVVGIGGASWYFFNNYNITVERAQNGTFQAVKIAPKTPAPGAAGNEGLPPAAPLRPSIRIASFNLDGLDDARLATRTLADVLPRMVSHFDVLAVQGVRGANRSVLVRLVEQVNALGRNYDFATCPTVQRDAVGQYNAFLFDAASVQIDRGTVHSVVDPAGRFHCKPLVGAFRVRGPAEKEAYTFTLVNVAVDADHAAAELDSLADVFRAVRDDGRGEDDVILLGDLEADDSHLGRLGAVPNLMPAITGMPTTTRGTRLVDNILFDRRATIEFTGRAGVLDLIREFDLTSQAAEDISGHLPVWAEFSCYEGGQPGHVARSGQGDISR